MLQVLQLPDGHRYYRGTIGSSSTDHNVPPEVIQTIFTPWFGPVSPNGPIQSLPALLTSVNGMIHDGGQKDSVGDRAVHHHQIDGVVTFCPFQSAAGSIVDDFYKHYYVQKGSSVTDYTHIITPGATFYKENTPWGYKRLGRIAHAAKNYTDGRWVFGYCSTTSTSTTGSMTYIRLLPTGKISKKTETIRDYETLKACAWVEPVSIYSLALTTPNFRGINAESIANRLGVFGQQAGWASFYPDLVPEIPYVFGDLAQSCIDQTRDVPTNTLSFVSELRDIAKLIPQIPLGAKALNPKAWASAYLGLQYGLKLTASDIRAIGAAIISARQDAKTYRDKTQRLFAGHTERYQWKTLQVVDTYHYKVTADPLDVPGMDIVRGLDKWGLYPTPERLWDMIPFSFVVDWFLKVGDYLGQVDSDLLSGFYRIRRVCWSRKVQLDYPLEWLFPGDQVQGYITLTSYSRNTSDKLHNIPFRIERAGEFRNWAEAAALIIVNRR